jgi:molybdopterin converting factor small subunit
VIVRYYAHLSTITNTDEETIKIKADITLDKLLIVIRNKHKRFVEKDMFLVSLNNKFIPVSVYGTTPLEDGDIVALFPPVSSG